MSRLINRTFLALGFTVSILSVFLFSPASHALTGASWNPANIINDSTFFNSSAMSTSDIQNFLNSMVPTCDTWGTQPSEYGGGTRRQWAEARGYAPPYTCLKDYQENGRSAAQIIKDASNQYNINPKVMIVLLQKEQSLVTDTWPLSSQYRTATGYGCPDTAPCDAEYYGFTNQVTKADFQFRRYATYPTEYRYKAFQTNYIQWNPNAACGGSNVYIQNQATAGLYNYTPYQPNAAALNNLYGTGDGCSAYGNRNFWRMYSDWFGSTQYEETILTFKSHVGGVGWTGRTTNSGVTGTTGQSKSLEAFKIDGAVNYTSYNNTTGWQPTISSGMISGTTGLVRPIQAIKITPYAPLSDKYDLYYRVHISGVGWMGWAKNGETAGVTGSNDRNIEAIEIRPIIKGYPVPEAAGAAYQNISTTSYNPPVSLGISSHVGEVGWQPVVTDTMVSGTTEQNKRIEAMKISLGNTTGLSGGVVYSAYVLGIGWQDFKSNNDVAGTTGLSRRMEAIRIGLTGSVGDSYDVWYRGYVQNIGWLNWAKNGFPVGSIGAGLQLEAIETRVVPKGSISLPQDGNLYNPTSQPIPANNSFTYSTHLSDVGWVGGTTQNVIGGTTGQSRAMEAIRFDTVTSIFGNLGITCSVYVKNTGWMNSISSGGICGTTGQSKPLEAIKLSLAGDAAGKYDIYYKVHLSYLGWQDWVKNDEQTGITGSNKQIEAIIVKLVQK